MDELVAALGPAFAAGFAVQRLLEIADPLINLIVGSRPERATFQKTLLVLLSLVAGLVIAVGAGLRVLEPLGATTSGIGTTIDVVATALVISAGTEGVNSILKFLG